MPAFKAGKSKVKMVVYGGPGETKVVWHSFLDQNEDSTTKIISGMKRRFSEKCKAALIPLQKIQVVQFYEWNVLFEEIKF